MSEQGKVHKIRVGVIFGGRSGEHEVSINSARSVMGALNRDKYEVIPIGIDRNGRWLTGDVMQSLAEGKNSSQPATLLPDPSASSLMRLETHGMQPASLSAVTELDVVIPVLHGTYGEDGTVQGLLELASLPYVGAGVVGSAVGMDKAIFKYVMVANGIPILPWLLFTRQDWVKRPSTILDKIEATLTYPVFTKPANLGSSVGICKCCNREELAAGIAEAANYDRRIVIEQGINVRELEVSVLGNEDPVASVVGEIRPRRDFYDYVAKYLAEPDSDEDSELIIPAELTDEQSDNVRTLAVKAYKAIDCAGLGRVDLMMDRDNGKLYLNEINTIPGFTNISMYPKLWEATGLSYSELLDRLIELAIERHDEKEKSKTTFDLLE
ncbi:MAG: D-alanine--D-alanine ligase [Chloroflexi bacterium]|nr:D-alanine--D-alanine ligase [Chloroflexota bacterium]